MDDARKISDMNFYEAVGLLSKFQFKCMQLHTDSLTQINKDEAAEQFKELVHDIC